MFLPPFYGDDSRQWRDPRRRCRPFSHKRRSAPTTPGEDLWQYSCTPGGFTFAAGQGFTVVFDRTINSPLQSAPRFVNGDWDPITVQPDLPLNSDGFYDALALRHAPSLADPFKVNVVWRGTGAPGPQPFTIYDTNFQPLVHGQTTSVPEPSAFALLRAASWLAAPAASRLSPHRNAQSPRDARPQ